MTAGNIKKTLAAGFMLVRKRKVTHDLRNVHYVVEQLEEPGQWLQIYKNNNVRKVKEYYELLIQDPKVLEVHLKHNILT